jgi:S1-C subfamily serine protease
MGYRRKRLRRPPETPALFPFPMMLVLAFAAVAACVQLAIGFGQRLTAPNERAASFVPFDGVSVEDVPLSDFLRYRTAVVLDGQRGEFGTATLVASDGYFLTAAHCVEHEPIRVGLGEWIKDARPEPARVVWRGDEDVALLKIDEEDLAEIRPATWASPAEIRDGMPVIAAGFGGNVFGSQFGCAAGFALGTLADGVLRHNAPVAPGDSGGPLVTPEGRLIGINVARAATLGGGRVAEALRPDPTFIEALIARDRAARAR